MKKLYLLMALVVLWVHSAQSLTIVRDFTGTAPTNTIGSGTWTNTINSACRVWETVFPGSGKLTIHFEWGNVSTATHYLMSQGGSPHRELEAKVVINGSPWFKWFIDADPLSPPSAYASSTVDLGGGPINAGRYQYGVSAEMSMDLFTTVLHEIGHALGLSMDNDSFSLICQSGSVTICTSLPYAGTVVPLAQNNGGFTSHIGDVAEGNLMSGLIGWCQRSLPSALDIVTLAQLSGYTEVNPDLAPVLSIGWPESVAGRPMPPILELSWIQPLPPPTGTQYRVQVCTNLAAGNWETAEGDAIVSNGVYRQLVAKTSDAAFFRLKAEPVQQAAPVHVE